METSQDSSLSPSVENISGDTVPMIRTFASDGACSEDDCIILHVACRTLSPDDEAVSERHLLCIILIMHHAAGGNHGGFIQDTRSLMSPSRTCFDLLKSAIEIAGIC